MPSVTINLNRLDYALSLSRWSFRHPVNLGAFGLLAVLIVIGHIPGNPVTVKMIVITVISGLLTAALCLTVGVIVSILGMVLIARSDRGVLGEHTYRFVEAGLIESTAVNENLMKWGGVRSVSRTRRFVYVRVTFSQGYTIPRRFFSDAAADEQFWNSLQPLVRKKV